MPRFNFHLKYLLPLIVAMSVAFIPGSNDPTVIQVGKTKIGYREFEERLNDVPLPNESEYTPEAVKQDLASTLVAETILASEAKKEHLENSPEVQEMSTEYFREALYEEWMKVQVKDSIKVTPQEIQVGYNRFKQIRYVDYWTSPNLEKAQTLRQRVVSGLEKNTSGKFKKLEYGMAKTDVEDTVFSMMTGQVSSPMKIGGEYFVFKLLGVKQNPKYAKHSVGFYRSTIVSRIRAKKYYYRMKRILDRLMAARGYNVDLPAYNYLLSKLAPVVFDTTLPNQDRGQAIQARLLSMSLKPNGMNDKPLVLFKNGKIWTVKDVWQKLSVCPYPLNYATTEKLHAGMLGVIEKLVILNTIARDAVAKGYSESHYVKYQTQMWSNSLLSNALLKKFGDALPIKESEVRAFYDSTKGRHLQPEMRRVLSVVVKNKKLADNLYHDIQRGADFIALAKKYNTTQIGLNGKRKGFFVTKDEWGNIGKAAFALKIGQVSVPQVVHDSTAIEYAIVRLLGIRKPAPYPYSQVHAQLFRAYKNWMLHKYVDRFLMKAVKNYRVVVNKPLLAEAFYAGGNMIVLKTHFPLRTGAPTIQFFNPPAGLTKSSGWKGMNSPMLADYYNYTQAKWFHE